MTIRILLADDHPVVRDGPTAVLGWLDGFEVVGAAARVTLVADGGGLRIEVVDGGTASGPWAAGVGLSSMRERAQELGGTLTAAGG